MAQLETFGPIFLKPDLRSCRFKDVVRYLSLESFFGWSDLTFGKASKQKGVLSSQVFFYIFLGGGFKYFIYFHYYLGKIPILSNIFQMG